MKTEFSLDFRNFNKKFTNIVQRAAPKSVEIGLREAGQELKLDADNVPPRTPKKEGFLRGSGKVSEVKVMGKSAEITVSYDKPYARRWHEVEPGTIKWSEPDVGPKYLESKMVRFKNKYMDIIAAVIRKRAK